MPFLPVFGRAGPSARRRTRRAVLLGAWALCAAAGPLHAQPARVPTVTRLVQLFMEREIALQERARAGDAAALGAMLTDDFELRAGSQPARPVPRAAYVADIVRQKPAQAAPTEMAVHDLGTTAIASFRIPLDSADAGLFVVDVWRQSGAEWKLAIRYAAPATAPGVAVPGSGGDTGDLPKRY